MPETKREQSNEQRFIDAAEKHWNNAMRGTPYTAGGLLFVCLDAAVGKLKVKDADKARKAFLQALRRRAR